MFYGTHLSDLCRWQQLPLPQDTEPGPPHIWQFSQALPLQNRWAGKTLERYGIDLLQINKLSYYCIKFDTFSSISWLCPKTFAECRPTIEKFIHKSLLVKVLWSFTSLEFVSPGSRANCFQVLKADGNLHCGILSALILRAQVFSSSSEYSLNIL